MDDRDADAIRRLLHAYADAVLERDEAAWGALWTEDARWELGPGRVVEGRAAIVDLWRTSMAAYRQVVQLYLSNTATVDGDAAAGRAYLVELNVPTEGDRRVLGRLVRRHVPARGRAVAVLRAVAEQAVRRRSGPLRAVLRARGATSLTGHRVKFLAGPRLDARRTISSADSRRGDPPCP